MKTREEILRRIKNAKSWRETGVTLDEAYTAFSDDYRGGASRAYKLQPDTAEHARNAVKTPDSGESEVIKELKEKIDRLTDANKQLRAQNKALKAGEKK